MENLLSTGLTVYYRVVILVNEKSRKKITKLSKKILAFQFKTISLQSNFNKAADVA